MISKEHFLKFSIKQQILKTAEQIRLCEKSVSENITPNTERLQIYCQYLTFSKKEKASAALRTIDRYIPKLKHPPLERKPWNLCFYELLNSVNEGFKEENYIPFKEKRFDSLSGTAKKIPAVIILENLRSAFNVGNIFRTSEAFGIEKVFLTGITPTPEHPRVRKTSMKTCDKVEWGYYKNTSEIIDVLSVQGYQITGAETIENSISLHQYNPASKTAAIFGNEEFGISRETLKLCDNYVSIPILGTKNSINVSNAFSIFSYHLMIEYNYKFIK